MVWEEEMISIPWLEINNGMTEAYMDVHLVCVYVQYRSEGDM